MAKDKGQSTNSVGSIDNDTPMSELGPAARAIRDITAYERDFKPWEERGKGIIDRYRDVRLEPVNQTFVLRKFNIFWSNIETLSQTLYARVPQVEVERRFKDNDDVGRYASEIAQRVGNYVIETSDFDDVMRDCVQDRLLPGRATAWIAYESEGDEEDVMETYTDDETGEKAERPKPEINPETGEEILNDDGTPKIETEYHKISEAIRPTYVHWKDFGHSPVRKWSEVKRVWRKVYMDRAELKTRFGDELASEIPLDRPRDKKGKFQNSDYLVPKATIYEVYDKDAKKVLWVHKTIQDEPLDEIDPPIQLDSFWPCPKPMWATMTNDTLIPIPDLIYYQDQTNELDEITNRISRMVDAMRIAGCYDASFPALERILQPNGSPENILVPVETWALLGEKGGVPGAISLVPLDMIAKALMDLYGARDQIKAIIYEVTGISDIIRGSTDPNETLGAQQLKGQFGSVRIRARQEEVANFARDMARLIVECGMQMFEPKTIYEMTMASTFIPMTPQDQQAMQYAQQNGLEPPLPEMFLNALKMLKDDKMRSFHIDIETDSTVALNETEDKQARVEFVGALGGFLEKAGPMLETQPTLAPLLGETLLYLVRGFRAGRPLEGAVEQAVASITQQAKAAAQAKASGKTPPDPKMIEAQADMIRAKGEVADKQAQTQADTANQQQDNARDAQYDKTDLTLRAVDEARDAKLSAADIVAKVSPIAGAKMAVMAASGTGGSGAFAAQPQAPAAPIRSQGPPGPVPSGSAQPIRPPMNGPMSPPRPPVLVRPVPRPPIVPRKIG